MRRVFGKAETAAIQLRRTLAPALVAELDWSSLRVEPGSFTDPGLATRRTDLLYSIAWRGSPDRMLVYVLMEHQSTVERLMALRLLLYLARIWESWLAARTGPVRTIPRIVPVLLYQGQGEWTAPRRLSELVADPPETATMPTYVELEYVVETLDESFVHDAQLRDDTLDRALALVEAARTLLWLAFHPEDVHGPRAQRLGALLDIVRQRWGLDELRALLTYMISVFEPETPLQGILMQSASQETREVITTIRDQWVAEGQALGRAEGQALGRAEGQALGMARMLEYLLDRRGLAPSDEQRQRVASCDDPELLQRWFDRALTASSAREVFDP